MASQQSNKLVVREQNLATVKNYLKQYIGQIAAALPKHMSPDRMARIALTEIRRSPSLQECDPISFFAAIIKSSQLGLEPGFDCSLVPFKREVQVLPGYRGYTKMARNSGEISTITAHVVYENDTYDFELGTNEHLVHRPKLDGTRGEMVFVYAVATFKDGIKQIEPMSREEVYHIRDKSNTYRNYIKNPTWPDGNPKDPPAWITDEAEMWKKTVVNRICKRLPMSAEMKEAIMMDYQAETGKSQDLKIDIFGDEIIDVGEDQFWDLCEQSGYERDNPDIVAYIKEVGEFYKKSEIHVMTEYGANQAIFEKFIEAFKVKMEKAKQKRVRKPKDTTSPTDTEPAKIVDEPDELIDCPNGDRRKAGYCQTQCSSRENCPSWPECEPGSEG